MRLGRFLFVLTFLLPFSARSAMLVDYTKRRFTLTGGIGLAVEDYDYCRGPGEYDRQTIREEITVNTGGFVWDPRFLSFDAGVAFYGENSSTSDGDSDNEMIGYQLGTTWFGHRKNPFTVHAAKRRNTVSDYLNPSYELDTETVAVRWGWESRLLGGLSFSFDTLDAESNNELVPREETSEVINVEGVRRIKRESGNGSDITYGYRSIDAEDTAVGTAQRQRTWYAYDRTRFDDRTSLNSNLTYYDREDVWADDPVNGTRELETEFFSFNSGLNVQSTDFTRHHYSLALSRNRVEETTTDTRDIRGGIIHKLDPNWEVHASTGISSRLIEQEERDEDRFADAATGFRYSNAFENLQVRSGYAFGYRTQIDATEEGDPGDSVTHSLDAGLTRRQGPEFQDAVDYYGNLRRDRLGRVTENNLRYTATGYFGSASTLQGVAEYRRYEDGTMLDKQVLDTTRISFNWTYRLFASNTLNLSAGRNDTRGDSRIEQTYAQGRITFSPRRWHNFRFVGMTRVEERDSAFGGEQSQLDVEGNLVHRFGRWESSLQYRYREFDGEEIDFTRERLVTLFVRRNFALRF